MLEEDEIDAIKAVLKWCKDSDPSSVPQVTYEPKGPSTAPDSFLKFANHSVALEVCQSGEGFTYVHNVPTPKEGYERGLANMIDHLKSLVEEWLIQPQTLMLTLLSPIPKYKRTQLAERISSELKKMYQRGDLMYQRGDLLLNQELSIRIPTFDTSINSIEICATLTNYYAYKPEYSKLKVTIACFLQSPNIVAENSLANQADCILQKKLIEKTKKTAHIKEEKWLAIIKTHPLLDDNDYQKAFNKLNNTNLRHDFTKVFIVEPLKIKAIEMTINQNSECIFPIV